MYLDTNILVYLSNVESPFHDRTKLVVAKAAGREQMSINQVVFAEFCVRYESAPDVTDWLASLDIMLVYSPPQALFRASRAFRSYRAVGGPRTSLLPDFFIGADAAIAGEALLTNDPGRYRTHFPELELITP